MFLLPETTVSEAGAGPEWNLGEQHAGTLALTLGITRAMERQSLELSIWGSPDGKDWGRTPLLKLPRKFYCGAYPILLDAKPAEVKYLRAAWQVDRWGAAEAKPRFTVYISGPE